MTNYEITKANAVVAVQMSVELVKSVTCAVSAEALNATAHVAYGLAVTASFGYDQSEKVAVHASKGLNKLVGKLDVITVKLNKINAERTAQFVEVVSFDGRAVA